MATFVWPGVLGCGPGSAAESLRVMSKTGTEAMVVVTMFEVDPPLTSVPLASLYVAVAWFGMAVPAGVPPAARAEPAARATMRTLSLLYLFIDTP